VYEDSYLVVSRLRSQKMVGKADDNRVILHRPYLRFDPAAYPESQEIVINAATIILTAYETAFQTKASVFWVWWSIPYRVSLHLHFFLEICCEMGADYCQTFHAGAACAFIAIREPNSDRGRKCLVCRSERIFAGTIG